MDFEHKTALKGDFFNLARVHGNGGGTVVKGFEQKLQTLMEELLLLYSFLGSTMLVTC